MNVKKNLPTLCKIRIEIKASTNNRELERCSKMRAFSVGKAENAFVSDAKQTIQRVDQWS